MCNKFAKMHLNKIVPNPFASAANFWHWFLFVERENDVSGQRDTQMRNGSGEKNFLSATFRYQVVRRSAVGVPTKRDLQS